jgi:hypothetical protein
MEDIQILRKVNDCHTSHLRKVKAAISNSSAHRLSFHTLCNDVPSHNVAERLYIFRASAKGLRSSSEFWRSSSSSIQNELHPWYFTPNVIRHRRLLSDWGADFGYVSIFLWGSGNYSWAFLFHHFVLKLTSTMLAGRWWDSLVPRVDLHQIHSFINGCTAICWALSAFSNSWTYVQSVGFLELGISPSQGRYLNTE